MRSPGRRGSLLSRILTRRVLLTICLGLMAGIAFVPDRLVRGVLLVVLLAVGIGWAAAWLSSAGVRLSQSGREMSDFRKYDDHIQPPP